MLAADKDNDQMRFLRTTAGYIISDDRTDWHNGSSVDSYLESAARFESEPGQRLSGLRFSIVFLIPSREIATWYLE
jgi:hypothetical protein